MVQDRAANLRCVWVSLRPMRRPSLRQNSTRRHMHPRAVGYSSPTTTATLQTASPCCWDWPDTRCGWPNGRAALALAQAFRPDTALLDIGMPDLNGYEVAQELRRAPWGSEICLIALTGWGQDSDRRRANHAGFNYHVTKPVDPGMLQALMRNDAARLHRG